MGERFVEKEEFETFKFNLKKKLSAKGAVLQSRTKILSADLTLYEHSNRIQFIDPGGQNRSIILPAENNSKNLFFFIFNTADAAEDLIVKDDGAATIVTISQDEGGAVFCDGTVWRGFISGIT